MEVGHYFLLFLEEYGILWVYLNLSKNISKFGVRLLLFLHPLHSPLTAHIGMSSNEDPGLRDMAI